MILNLLISRFGIKNTAEPANRAEKKSMIRFRNMVLVLLKDKYHSVGFLLVERLQSVASEGLY